MTEAADSPPPPRRAEGSPSARRGTSPARGEERSTISVALKDAGLWAVAAFLLAVPLLAWRTVETQTNLQLVSRWGEVAIAVAVVFAARLALSLGGAQVLAAAPVIAIGVAWSSAMARVTANSRWVAPALAGCALVLPFTPFADRYALDLAILVVIYIVLGWGLNIVVGLAGLLDLGYVAFYGIGAYSHALLAQSFGLSFWTALPLAGICAAFWGVVLGFPVLRLRGDYLAIVTLAFGEIIHILLINWKSLTGGPDGLSGIPRPSLLGLELKPDCGVGTLCGVLGIEYWPLQRFIWLYYCVLALALLVNWVSTRMRRMPIGRAWEALREDEIACRALGLNTTTIKLTAFGMGALFGGLAGPFFATKQGIITPESFTFIESAMILAIVVLGGMGSQLGVAIAAIVMVGGIELFRDLQIYRMLVFGLAMVAMMIWRPRGFVGSRTPSITLGGRSAISGSLVKEGQG